MKNVSSVEAHLWEEKGCISVGKLKVLVLFWVTRMRSMEGLHLCWWVPAAFKGVSKAFSRCTQRNICNPAQWWRAVRKVARGSDTGEQLFGADICFSGPGYGSWYGLFQIYRVSMACSVSSPSWGWLLRTAAGQWKHWMFCCRGNSIKAEVPKEHFENSRMKNTCRIPEISHKYDKVAEGKPALQIPGTLPEKTP